jgi:hypothetical protein
MAEVLKTAQGFLNAPNLGEKFGETFGMTLRNRRKLVGVIGFEPTTPSSRTRQSRVLGPRSIKVYRGITSDNLHLSRTKMPNFCSDFTIAIHGRTPIDEHGRLSSAIASPKTHAELIGRTSRISKVGAVRYRPRIR